MLFRSAGWWQKPTRRAWCKQCARCGIVKEYGKNFHKIGGECLTCEGGSRTTNQNPQQPLIVMIFTNADLRYASRLDDKQGDDTIVTMERVREQLPSMRSWRTSQHGLKAIACLTLSIVAMVLPPCLSSNLPAYLGSALVKIMPINGCCGF